MAVNAPPMSAQDSVDARGTVGPALRGPWARRMSSSRARLALFLALSGRERHA